MIIGSLQRLLDAPQQHPQALPRPARRRRPATVCSRSSIECSKMSLIAFEHSDPPARSAARMRSGGPWLPMRRDVCCTTSSTSACLGRSASRASSMAPSSIPSAAARAWRALSRRPESSACRSTRVPAVSAVSSSFRAAFVPSCAASDVSSSPSLGWRAPLVHRRHRLLPPPPAARSSRTPRPELRRRPRSQLPRARTRARSRRT